MRFDADRARSRQVASTFLAAVTSGDLDGLLAILADDVVVHSDGGGKAKAGRRPVAGRDKAARFLLGISRKAPEGGTLREAPINGQPGAVIEASGQVVGAIAVDVVEGLVTGVRIMLNPDKLAGLRA